MHICTVDLMSALMSIVYQHLLSAKDMLICVQLLQLIELRARNWRPNASADHFYHTQHSMLVEQVACILTTYLLSLPSLLGR